MPYTLLVDLEGNSMLEPKEAVEKAQQHLVELRPDLAELNVRMEEIEPIGDLWKITFGALNPPLYEGSGGMAEFLRPRKIYKVVEVRAEDGSFVSLKDRAA
jgi:hypothetical protein